MASCAGVAGGIGVTQASGVTTGADGSIALPADRIAVREVVFEVVERAAGVRLVSVREDTLAFRATPERVAGGVSVRGEPGHGPNVMSF